MALAASDPSSNADWESTCALVMPACRKTSAICAICSTSSARLVDRTISAAAAPIRAPQMATSAGTSLDTVAAAVGPLLPQFLHQLLTRVHHTETDGDEAVLSCTPHLVQSCAPRC